MTTNPGVHSDFRFDFFSSEERQIVYGFATHFYVTKAIVPFSIGNMEVRAFQMRPGDLLANLMNIEREFVVLLSPYSMFENRTLEAYKEIYASSMEGTRIDKSIQFIVSKDPKIEATIRNYLTREPEHPLIIPFRYDEISTKQSDFVLQRIRSNHLIRDLFSHQSPLRNEYYYFGRTKIIAQAVDLHKSGQNSSLFGLRKSGKTSTIYAIQRKARSAGENAIVIDCQDPSVHSRNYGDLLAHILEQTRQQLNLKREAFSFGGKAHLISDNFSAAATKTLSDAKGSVLILLDEIENISPNTSPSSHWRDGSDTIQFWQILRSFSQKQSNRTFTFCFVGTNPSLLETTRFSDLANPVYLFAPKTYMPNLTYEEVKQMVGRLGYFMGLDFDDEVISYLHNQYGGHPFFIRQLCSKVNTSITVIRPTRVSIADCKQAERSTAADLRIYISDILLSIKQFYPEEWEMLQYLHNNDLESFHGIARDYPAMLEHLVGYNILVNRGLDYEFTSDAIRNALSEMYSPKLNTPSLDERWAEISRRRNKIEEQIRSALYQWANLLSDADWDDALKKCLREDRRHELGPLIPRAAFSKNQSPLYFLELKKFVILSSRFHDNNSDRKRIESAFGKVNNGRADAHAKEINTEDFNALDDALQLLEEMFVAP